MRDFNFSLSRSYLEKSVLNPLVSLVFCEQEYCLETDNQFVSFSLIINIEKDHYSEC